MGTSDLSAKLNQGIFIAFNNPIFKLSWAEWDMYSKVPQYLERFIILSLFIDIYIISVVTRMRMNLDVN